MGTTSGSAVDAAAQDGPVVAIVGALAGMSAWLGWLTVCPALGFPTLATAAMLNRVFAPREDPGSWPGWALLVIGLASAALLYLAAADRGRLRPSITSGAVYGATCWLVAGAVVMPLLGLAVPTVPPTTPPALTPPDPMHGSLMMLHLGLAAPLAALIAWLLFGAVLGATARSRSSDATLRGTVSPAIGRTTDPGAVRMVALGSGLIVLVVAGLVVARILTQTGPSPAGARTLASGPVATLPQGALFFSIVELPQAAGGVLGPHAHVPGFAYSLNGVETLSFDDGRTVRVGPGEGGFMGTQAAHAHLNADDRVPAAVLAMLIVALVGVVGLIWFRRATGTGRLLPVVLVVLIGAGSVATWDPWSNDWLFLSVRPAAARGAPMPIPTAVRAYESPDLGALPAGPYVETLEEIVVAPGAAPADLGSTGAVALFVLDGRLDIGSTGGPSIQIGSHGSTLIQPGTSVQLSNAGDRPLHLLRFAVMPAPPGG
jgi:hypothetical protein